MLRVRLGDVVRLKSGGPEMTIEGIRSAGAVDCVWFDGGERQTAMFFTATLDSISRAAPERAEPEEKPQRIVRKPRKGMH